MEEVMEGSVTELAGVCHFGVGRLVGQASTPAAGLQTRRQRHWDRKSVPGGRADLEAWPTAMFPKSLQHP
jgi:hypothetical protein